MNENPLDLKITIGWSLKANKTLCIEKKPLIGIYSVWIHTGSTEYTRNKIFFYRLKILIYYIVYLRSDLIY